MSLSQTFINTHDQMLIVSSSAESIENTGDHALNLSSSEVQIFYSPRPSDKSGMSKYQVDLSSDTDDQSSIIFCDPEADDQYTYINAKVESSPSKTQIRKLANAAVQSTELFSDIDISRKSEDFVKIYRSISSSNGLAIATKSNKDIFKEIMPEPYELEVTINAQLVDAETQTGEASDSEEITPTFLTQNTTKKLVIASTSAGANSHSSSFTITLKKKENRTVQKRLQELKSQSLVKNKKSKRSTNSRSSYSKLPPLIPQKQNKKPIKDIDLSIYDYPPPDEIIEIAKGVPAMVFAILKAPEESIYYRAVCFEAMSDYPKPVVNAVLNRMNILENELIRRNLINESAHVDAVIKSIQNESKAVNSKKQDEANDLSERVEKAEGELETRRTYWNKKRAELEESCAKAASDLLVRYEDEKAKLCELWQSDAMKARYDKPSPQIAEAQFQARQMLTAGDFDGAAFYTKRSNDLVEKEAESAAIRIQKDFEKAAHTLQVKFANESKVIKATRETKLANLLAAEDSDVRPYQARLDYLKVRRDQAVSKKIKEERAEMKMNAKVKKYKIRSDESTMERLCPLSL